VCSTCVSRMQHGCNLQVIGSHTTSILWRQASDPELNVNGLRNGVSEIPQQGTYVPVGKKNCGFVSSWQLKDKPAATLSTTRVVKAPRRFGSSPGTSPLKHSSGLCFTTCSNRKEKRCSDINERSVLTLNHDIDAGDTQRSRGPRKRIISPGHLG